MITQIQSDKLIVISDLHLGNPVCRSKRQIIQFLNRAANQGYDLCINGDVFEVAQVSFHKLAKDVPDFLHALKVLGNKGCNVYYVVGNHDIILENFLDEWGNFKIAPFLNVISGGQRIRIEHGHLYDPLFVRYPLLYEFFTRLFGFPLRAFPGLYKAWIAVQRFSSYRRAKHNEVITVEHPSFTIAAHEIAQRGFDHIIFGHTHYVDEVDLGNGKRYFNPGASMIGRSYIEVLNGKVCLLEWDLKNPF
jgi:UDP-2,3-diacylglucosamine pyrophosphatase LpxH